MFPSCRFAAFLFLTCSACLPVYGQTPEEQVRALIDQVSLDSLVHYVRALSGEDSVRLPQQDPFVISSRRAGSSDHALAQRYLDVILPSVYQEQFRDLNNRDGTNLFGIHPSRYWQERRPDGGWTDLFSSVHEWPDKYILCAHYDSGSFEGLAPGANDNASGVAVVLEAARLLRQLDTKYTVVFALFDREEQGHKGSKAYVSLGSRVNEDIRGVINLDMVGWDADPLFSGDWDFWIAPDSAHPTFAETILSLSERYDIDTEGRFQPGSYSSDHVEFRKAGYPATVISEVSFWVPQYPYYHTDGDTIGHFNLDLFHKRAQLAVAAIAHFALGVDEVGVGTDTYPELPETVTLSQNYPNPFNPATTISYALPQAADATISVFDLLGRTVRVLTSGTKPAGTYEVTFDATGLPSGVYFYQLEAGGVTETKRMVVVK
jgi:hypothetical protein